MSESSVLFEPVDLSSELTVKTSCLEQGHRDGIEIIESALDISSRGTGMGPLLKSEEDELKVLMENNPMQAEALADSLGKDVSSLDLELKMVVLFNTLSTLVKMERDDKWHKVKSGMLNHIMADRGRCSGME